MRLVEIFTSHLLYLFAGLCAAVCLISAGALPAASQVGEAGGAEQTASDTSDTSEAADAPESEREKDVADFESLRAKRIATLSRIAALESDAQASIGEDQYALRAEALELRLEGVQTLIDMGAVVESLEARADDTSAQHRVLASLLQPLQSAVESTYSRQEDELKKAKKERDEAADAELVAALDPAIQRKEELLLRILDAAADLSELAQKVDVPVETTRDWIAQQVLERARLASSHVNLALYRLDDLADRKAAGADPATLQSAEGAARHRLESASGSLEEIVGLMERLELDGADYRQILIESTGEITVDSFDRRVAGNLLSRWATDLREGFVDNAPGFAFQVLLFAIIVAFFWGLARFVRQVVVRAVEAPHLRFSQLLKRMIVSMSSGAVVVLGLLVAFSQLGIEVGPMLAGLGIAGFVLGFALQDTLGNFAAGIMILIYRPYDVEDMIDCAGGVFGKVSHMSLVSTTILTIDNKTLIVPNSKIWGDVITNVTAQSIRRVDLEFGIGYSDDISQAEKVLQSILDDHPKILADPEPIIRVHALADSSVNFVVRPWVGRDDYWDVYWDVTREVKLRFDREGVSIPFPQRDVHFYPT